jgi:predicted GNAT family N-acyltransferase
MPSSAHESLVVTQVDIADLPACLAIRRVVFIEGQNVPESIEVDGLDETAQHFLARAFGAALGTARMRLLDHYAKAERVAVLEAGRGHGVGRALMDAIERAARQMGVSSIMLNAQTAVLGFYTRLGYVAEGEVFFEADIAHQRMTKALK